MSDQQSTVSSQQDMNGELSNPTSAPALRFPISPFRCVLFLDFLPEAIVAFSSSSSNSAFASLRFALLRREAEWR